MREKKVILGSKIEKDPHLEGSRPDRNPLSRRYVFDVLRRV